MNETRSLPSGNLRSLDKTHVYQNNGWTCSLLSSAPGLRGKEAHLPGGPWKRRQVTRLRKRDFLSLPPPGMRPGEEELAGQPLLTPVSQALSHLLAFVWLLLARNALPLLCLGDFYLFFKIPSQFPSLSRDLSLTSRDIPHPGQVTRPSSHCVYASPVSI